jgi:hypothetical protein
MSITVLKLSFVKECANSLSYTNLFMCGTDVLFRLLVVCGPVFVPICTCLGEYDIATWST